MSPSHKNPIIRQLCFGPAGCPERPHNSHQPLGKTASPSLHQEAIRCAAILEEQQASVWVNKSWKPCVSNIVPVRVYYGSFIVYYSLSQTVTVYYGLMSVYYTISKFYYGLQIYLQMCLPMNLKIYQQIYLNKYLQMYLQMSLQMYLQMCLQTYLRMYLQIYVQIHICKYIYIYIYIYICKYICKYMC